MDIILTEKFTQLSHTDMLKIDGGIFGIISDVFGVIAGVGEMFIGGAAIVQCKAAAAALASIGVACPPAVIAIAGAGVLVLGAVTIYNALTN
jgi:hypothetical protein